MNKQQKYDRRSRTDVIYHGFTLCPADISISMFYRCVQNERKREKEQSTKKKQANGQPND